MIYVNDDKMKKLALFVQILVYTNENQNEEDNEEKIISFNQKESDSNSYSQCEDKFYL
jgi:hypothetical protein